MSSVTKQLNELRTSTLGNAPVNPLNVSTTSKRRETESYYQSTLSNINLYTSPSRGKSDIELLVPRRPFSKPSRGTEKIKREIKQINKEMFGVVKDAADLDYFKASRQGNFDSYKNRPIINLTSNNLDFSPRKTIANSPTQTTGVTRSILGHIYQGRTRNEGYGTNYNFTPRTTRNGITNLRTVTGKDQAEHQKFMREMSSWKEKKMAEWKNL